MRIAGTMLVCVLVLAGCAKHEAKPTIRTVTETVSSPATVPTTTTSTDTVTGATTDSHSHTPSTPPRNLTATPAMKAELLTAARAQQDRQNGVVSRDMRIGGIGGADKGTTYYAQWGDYEYATASFPHSTGPNFTDYLGLFYRPLGGAWHAAAMKQQGDVECNFPRGFDRIWGHGASGCSVLGALKPRSRTFSSLGDGFVCRAEFPVGARSWLDCLAHDPASFHTIGTRGLDGLGHPHEVRLGRLESSYADDIAGFDVPYTLSSPDGGGDFVCTFEPDAVHCTGPNGGTLELTRPE